MSERPILLLEPVGGIAGDMFLAAAIDLGVAPAALEQMLAGLGVPGWKLEVTRAERHAISGTHVDVIVDMSSIEPQRRYRDIIVLIDRASTLPDRAKARARKIFEVIAIAEAKIHGVPLDEVHFHEVGAVDSIVDVCGAAAALELLGDPEILSTPPPLGSGFVKAAHGNMPVPAPATLEILRDVPVRFEGVGELTTPTGAALLKGLARVESPPPLVVEKIGYGVGTKDFKDRPNVLRASLARRATSAGETWLLEANLDDCSPQILGALIDRCLQLGAHDAFITPVTMKKSRPGQIFSVLAPASAKDAIAAAILEETTTLGLRLHAVERITLERSFETVETRFGPVRMKLGRRDGTLLNAQPEFEDCRALAEKAKVPVKHVLSEAIAAFLRR